MHPVRVCNGHALSCSSLIMVRLNIWNVPNVFNTFSISSSFSSCNTHRSSALTTIQSSSCDSLLLNRKKKGLIHLISLLSASGMSILNSISPVSGKFLSCGNFMAPEIRQHRALTMGKKIEGSGNFYTPPISMYLSIACSCMDNNGRTFTIKWRFRGCLLTAEFASRRPVHPPTRVVVLFLQTSPFHLRFPPH
jgi:hypothetical protein